MQLDKSLRGFSFRNDGPLDMRMSRNGPTASDFVNNAEENLIAEVIYKYGEESKSKIKKAIQESKDAAFPNQNDLLTDVYIKY